MAGSSGTGVAAHQPRNHPADQLERSNAMRSLIAALRSQWRGSTTTAPAPVTARAAVPPPGTTTSPHTAPTMVPLPPVRPTVVHRRGPGRHRAPRGWLR